MGIAALVLGIVSIILSFIPFISIFAFVPALLGIIFGIVELVSKKRGKANPLTGVILSSLAIVIIGFYLFVYIVFGLAIMPLGNMLEDLEDYPKHHRFEHRYDFDKFDTFEDFDDFEF